MANAAIVVSILALVLSVINFVVTLILTIRRDVGTIRPVLVFTYKAEGWHVENLGNGPALDVIFHRLAGESVTQNVRLPALTKGAEFCVHFARHDAKQIFVTTYRDADGRPYSSRSQHDLSTSTKGFEVQRVFDSESLDRWWELKDREG
ncbi:MAG: hypothetical protein H0T74_04180 [Rubrobacteraceae bacterium]|jgi:hypothetical protein|nr:hypothetical protein [Rubrobacteraceae bacterium]